MAVTGDVRRSTPPGGTLADKGPGSTWRELAGPARLAQRVTNPRARPPGALQEQPLPAGKAR